MSLASRFVADRRSSIHSMVGVTVIRDDKLELPSSPCLASVAIADDALMQRRNKTFLAIPAPRSISTFRRSLNLENFKEFASSTNGDRWLLGTDVVTNREMVVHQGNPSSGGHETTMPVSAFLNQRPFGPEHQALYMFLADRRAAENEEAAVKPG